VQKLVSLQKTLHNKKRLSETKKSTKKICCFLFALFTLPTPPASGCVPRLEPKTLEQLTFYTLSQLLGKSIVFIVTEGSEIFVVFVNLTAFQPLGEA